MVHLYRLTVWLLLALAVPSAFAVISPVPKYRYADGFVGTAGEIVAHQQSLEGSRGCGYGSGTTTYQISARNQTSESVEIWYSYVCSDTTVPPGQGLAWTATVAGSTCPANSSDPGDGTCTCNAGFEDKDGQCKPKNPCPVGQHEEGGACVPDNCKSDEVRVNGVCVKEPPCPAGETRVNGVCKKNGCTAGKSVGDRITSGDNVTYSCEDGCTVRTNPSICIKFGDVVECTGTGRLTGSTCTPGDGGGDGPNPGDGGGNNPGNNPGTNPGTGGNGTGGTGTGGTGTGSGGTGTGTGSGGTGTGGTGTGGTGTGGTGTGGTGTGGTGTGGTGTGGTGSGSGGTPYPPPKPIPPAEDGSCGLGYHKSGTVCIKDPAPPDGDGKCPEGSVKVNDKCVFTEPGTGGGGNGNGSGNGNGDGDDKSGFGGSCAAGFACEGDAIQCAIAKEQHIRNCKLFDDKSPESDLYKAEAAKDRSRDVTKDLPGNETIDVSSKLSRENLLGGAACISDLNIQVWGKAISLPISTVCPALGYLGYVLVTVASLAAFRIVSGATKGD